MAGHKKGKARAERRERAAARESDAAQQPEASTAAQQPGPSSAVQQPGPSNAIRQPVPSTSVQASEPKNAVQRIVTGIQREGEENTEQIINVEDEPVLPTLPEEQLGEAKTGLTQQENAATEDNEENEDVPTDTVSTGEDHAGLSKRLERSCHGNVNYEHSGTGTSKEA